MHLYGALIMLTTLTVACGLRCYVCPVSDPKSCTGTLTCPTGLDRCYTLKADPLVSKGCLNSMACVDSFSCCEGDLCNSAVPTGPSVVLLLLASSVISALFL